MSTSSQREFSRTGQFQLQQLEDEANRQMDDDRAEYVHDCWRRYLDWLVELDPATSLRADTPDVLRQWAQERREQRLLELLAELRARSH